MKTMHSKGSRLAVTIAMVLGGSIATEALGQSPNISVQGATATYTVPAAERQSTSPTDIGGAQVMPLPTVDLPPIAALDEPALQPQTGAATATATAPTFSPGFRGNGVRSPVRVPPNSATATADAFQQTGTGVTPQEYGTLLPGIPYTTNRVDTVSNNVSSTYPYRAVGRLYFKNGTIGYVCSASLIKRGLVVTAAHCVAPFGSGRYYTNFQFVPAQYNTLAPFGTWLAEAAIVPASYLNGTSPCYNPGVVCANDVAVIRIAPQAGAFPGTATGWLGYGVSGYGFTPGRIALVSQLGYPVSHDGGTIMQRTDSQGTVAPPYSNNTVWGSRQTGGSSGGPIVANLGISGVLNTPLGGEAATNTVVGVTSWGYINPAVKREGASPFTSGNIVPLVKAACVSGAVTRPACL